MNCSIIKNPDTGKMVRSDSKKGKQVIQLYNKYSNIDQRGGSAVMIGAIGTVIVIGGLLAYTTLFKESSLVSSSNPDSPNYKISLFKGDILFMSKLTEQSSKEDILKAYNKVKEWNKYFNYNIT